MFPVQGWKLGRVVSQTAPKKKRKRKGEEEKESATNVPPIQPPRANPFSFRPSSSLQDFDSKQQSTPGKITKRLEQEKDDSKDAGHSRPATGKSLSSKARKRRKLELHTEAEELLPPANKLSMKLDRLSRGTNLTPLQQKMRTQLSGSQFRYINEKLYTSHSSEALTLFGNKPSLFYDYHEGFRHQVQSWPSNPVGIFIDLLSTKGANLAVADLGCGDAALAQHFRKHKRIKVRSFDLVKANEFVEVCDIAEVPLRDQSIDIAVFCLSLMGSNFLAFIEEACRLTKLHGEIWIAEIKSRFIDPTFKTFIARLNKMGLKLMDLNQDEKMFVIMRFEKVSDAENHTSPDERILLKACLYKKR